MIPQPIKEFFATLFYQRTQAPPPDLTEFQRARQRLHRATRTFKNEIDTFGIVVRDMQGVNGRKHGNGHKRPKKKKERRR